MDEQRDSGAVERLAQRMLTALQRERWNQRSSASDLASDLEGMVGYLQRSIDLSADLRALLTAFAHVFQEPRPNIARLARAQGVTPAGIRRRYSDDVVGLVRNLISGAATVDQVTRALPSTTPAMLFGVTPAIDRELQDSHISRLSAAPFDTVASVPFYVDIRDATRTEVPVSREETKLAERYVEPSLALLGIVSRILSGKLSAGGHYEAWIPAPSQAKVEWTGSLQVSQAVAELVPYYADFPKTLDNLVSGLHGLRVEAVGESTSTLVWSAGDDEVHLFLSRLPSFAFQV